MQYKPEFDIEEMGNIKPVTMQPVFSGDEFLRQIDYPVIVESWEKRRFGRGKRKWMAEFTEAERQTIAKYQTKFYRWYLVTGKPDRVMIRLKTLHLLQRAVAFFASI